MSAGVSDPIGKPNASIARSSRSPLSAVGRTSRSRSPVNRGTPCRARACAPTTTNSTPWTFNDAQNSLKSGARSNELSPEKLDSRYTLGRGTGKPVRERRIARGFEVEARDGERASIKLKLHGPIVPAGTYRRWGLLTARIRPWHRSRALSMAGAEQGVCPANPLRRRTSGFTNGRRRLDCAHIRAEWIGRHLPRASGWFRSRTPDRQSRLRRSRRLLARRATDRLR
jgi:hypothetical protein